MHARLTRAAGVVTAGAVALAVLLPGLTTTASAATVPGGLKVARAGDGTDLAITWGAVAGVDHYSVSVFDGTTDRVQVLDAKTTALTFDGSGACTHYRVRVTAVATDGSVATTNDYLVNSLAPGGVAKSSASRVESGASGVLTWSAPAWTGAAPLSAYLVKVTNMSTNKVVLDTKTADLKIALGALEPARQYSAKITPVNAYGSCFTSTAILYGARPSQPQAFTVDRDPATPSKLAMHWTAPVWSGYGPLTEYEFGYGDVSITKWVRLKNPSYALTLDPAVGHVFAVRAISSNDIGILSKPTFLAKYGAAGTPVVDPKVTVDELNGTVTVSAVGPVGTSAAYPKMRITIDPTLKGSWRDEHVVANGASQAVFSQVPCGVFTVLVTGYGKGSEKEFGRKLINRCDTGAVTADLWKVVYGSATVKGNSVDVTTAGERRIMSTVARTSQDMVLTTTADLRVGTGYGVWARADVSAGGASVSGYSMQFDPGYAAVSPSFGKAILLRLWSKGSECGTPLAKVPFPAGVDVYSPHRFMVVVKGDTLFATIDDKVVFNVPSLAAAVKTNGCGMPAPTGTQIGFRTWGSTTASFTDTTVN
jgi:hypothetical protein